VTPSEHEMPVGAIVVDFDGTACTVDVSETLLREFGDPVWETYNDMVDRGELGLREAAHRQAALLTASREEMLAFAIEHCPLDPTFAPFVAWARERALPLTLVSDGFAFYIRPILEAGGIVDLDVITNEMRFDDGDAPRLTHPNAHPECIGCGTCKMRSTLAFREAHGPVAFIGEGLSDRYGALYSDVVFAKDVLVDLCERDGVPYLAWDTFDDVREALEAMREPPGPVAPTWCPGWTDP